MTLEVFFSYDSDDRLLVGRLKDGIENRSNQDVDIYIYEEDRRLGEPIAQKAKNRIRQADLFIVLITPNSKNSMWVHQEIGFAEGVDCPVVPIVHEEIDLLEIRGLLSGVEYLSLDPRHPDDFFREFLEYIDRTFEASPAEEHKRRGDSLRADAEEHHEGSNFDSAMERYEAAIEAYETARGLAAQHDHMDAEEIQGIIDDVESDLRSVRRKEFRAQLESLRNRFDEAEALVDENALAEAEDELEAVRSRLDVIETPIAEAEFEDLQADLTSLRQQCDDRLQDVQLGEGAEKNSRLEDGNANESKPSKIGQQSRRPFGIQFPDIRGSRFVDTLTDVDELDARTVALIAVFAGLVLAMEVIVFPAVGSIYPLGTEIVIYTAAFLFGGVVSGLAGGIGITAIVMLNPSTFPVVLFIGPVKGAQGFVVGQVAGETIRSKAIAVAAGLPLGVIAILSLPAPYYLEGVLFLSLLDAAIGFIFALPLSWVLQRFVPRLRYASNPSA